MFAHLFPLHDCHGRNLKPPVLRIHHSANATNRRLTPTPEPSINVNQHAASQITTASYPTAPSGKQSQNKSVFHVESQLLFGISLCNPREMSM